MADAQCMHASAGPTPTASAPRVFALHTSASFVSVQYTHYCNTTKSAS